MKDRSHESQKQNSGKGPKTLGVQMALWNVLQKFYLQVNSLQVSQDTLPLF